MKTKTFNHYYKIFFVVIFSFSLLSLKAGNIKVKQGENKLTVKENTYSILKFSNSFSDLTYKDIKTENGVFTELSIPDYGNSNRIGDPKLPELKKLIEIPLGSVPEIKIIIYSTTEYKL